MNARMMLVFGGIAGALTSLPETAAAEDRASCEVLMIHALRDNRGIDQALSSLRALREPPFSAYSTLKLLRRSRVQLAQGTAQTLALPTGRSLRLSLLGRGGAPGGQPRLRFNVSITRPGRSDYLPAAEYETQRGEPFFQAGQTYQNGVLVLAFVCR